MSVDIPGGVASAALIAARSEPAPESERFVTTMIFEYARARLAVAAAWAVAAALAWPAVATDAQAATQAAAPTRHRIIRTELPRVNNARRGNLGNLGYAAKANIVSLLP